MNRNEKSNIIKTTIFIAVLSLFFDGCMTIGVEENINRDLHPKNELNNISKKNYVYIGSDLSDENKYLFVFQDSLYNGSLAIEIKKENGNEITIYKNSGCEQTGRKVKLIITENLNDIIKPNNDVSNSDIVIVLMPIYHTLGEKRGFRLLYFRENERYSTIDNCVENRNIKLEFKKRSKFERFVKYPLYPITGAIDIVASPIYVICTCIGLTIAGVDTM